MRSFATESENQSSSQATNGLEDIIRNYKSVSSPSERLKLLIQVSIGALRQPERADLVSACGDLSSHVALDKIHQKMLADEEGKAILLEKPRVTPQTWDLDKLLALPAGTFGHEYAFWMRSHGYTSAERPVVKYVPNLEHAYIMQRYKEVHDSAHVLLGYGTTVTEEIAVKWFEMMQTELPMSALASFVGPMNLIMIQRDADQVNKLIKVYLPHIMQNAKTSKMFLNVYFERHFETPIDELRAQLNIKPLVIH